MTTLKVNTIEPASGTSLIIGESGQDTIIGGNTLKVDRLQDAGGNTILQSDGSGTLSNIAAGFGSDMKLLVDSGAIDDDADVTFSSTYVTNTYKEYQIRYYYMRPATDATALLMDFSIDNGTNWGIASSTCFWYQEIEEAGGSHGSGRNNSFELNSSTSGWTLNNNVGNATRQCAAGQIRIYDPSDTTRSTRATSDSSSSTAHPRANGNYFGGVVNSSSAINAIRIRFSSGNITTGRVKLWGIV